jgi:RNA polymerase sigma-70 factor (ECF subfamily)
MKNILEQQFECSRKELTAYLCRLVVRPQVAEELVQTTFLKCFEASGRLPDDSEGVRAWLFKVATNLAFDELRRHSNWRENVVLDLREVAEASPVILEQSINLIGTPETKAIAREHLVACLSCTLRNLSEHKAAALLLKEVHGFSLEEIAELLEATHVQVKNWLQEARNHLFERYSDTCALMQKKGVCYQCVELDEFFSAKQGNPLSGDLNHIDSRLNIAKELNEKSWGKWHQIVLGLLDEIV